MEEDSTMNTDHAVDEVADYLAGKSVALCVTGGIAAIEAPKLARHLRRYGAQVTAYTTPAARTFVGDAALEWGTGRPVVSTLSGGAEHLCKSDAVLVCPATMNTISKASLGIADNPVTTLIASAIGARTPLLIAPTMHDSLYANPFLQEHLAKLARAGVTIVPPREEEGKRKIPKLDTIVAAVSRELSTDPLKGKRLLITGGPTPVRLDAVRRITNVFKGKLPIEIAKDAYLRGADVRLLLGDTGLSAPEYVPVTRHQDYDEYRANVHRELAQGYDAGIFAAAVADYRPAHVHDGKFPSRNGWTIEMTPTQKVIAEVREQHPELYMATFKLQSHISKEDLLGIARARLKDYEIVVANRSEDMHQGHLAYLLTRSAEHEAHGKTGIARKLLDLMGEELQARPRGSPAYAASEPGSWWTHPLDDVARAFNG